MNRKNIIIIGSTIGIIMILIAIFLYFNSNKNYVVTFDTNGGSSVASQTIEKGGSATKPSNPEKEGYEFVGWSYNGNNYDFSSKVNNNINLIALWKENKNDLIKSYIVVFDSDGGSNIKSQNIIENSACVEPTNPTKEGFIFDGWYLGDVKYNFEEKITKNIILKAKWINSKSDSGSNKNPNTNTNTDIAWYKITFDSDGGTGVNEQWVMTGRTATIPTTPTKNGKIFAEWQLNGKKYDFNNKVTSNINLKAKWRDPKLITLTFMFDDNNVWETKTVLEGDIVGLPKTPGTEGFILGGWYLNGKDYTYNLLYVPLVSESSNLTLKAHWIKAYKIVFSGTQDITTWWAEGSRLGEIMSGKEDITYKDGYIFKGWKYNGQFVNADTIINGNMTLIAEWEPVQ